MGFDFRGFALPRFFTFRNRRFFRTFHSRGDFGNANKAANFALVGGGSVSLHEAFQPIGFLHPLNGVVDVLDSRGDGDDLLDGVGETVDVVVPVDEIANIEVRNRRIVRPFPQEIVPNFGLRVEDGGRNGPLRDGLSRGESRDDHVGGGTRRLLVRKQEETPLDGGKRPTWIISLPRNSANRRAVVRLVDFCLP